jgi:hypothetical protein
MSVEAIRYMLRRYAIYWMSAIGTKRTYGMTRHRVRC